ncbi:MFS transporter [Salinibacterium sp. G-O1]|uniref:MFS transporter n=1 Tax=Salinibacterium sp. G-O1 TaxID=3046208 RepID=UPI0024BA880B|nr:MFS transporter [Salinibacterium sp. G-O1]MDJ0336567.1 MFS transporter [Salinibacterium sp. G-O1]
MTTVTSAWSSPPFRRVWGAGAISALGAEIGELAIPVLALVTLGASATELSFVRAALLLPYLILTLWLGVLVDRHPRRPLMIGADLGRALLLGLVCWFAIAGWLTIPMLIAVAGLIGALAVLYTLADFSFIPLVVDEHQLIDANARITAAQSAIGVAGAGAGGALVQLLTAPFALLVNAVGYLVSGILIARVHVDDPPAPREQRRSAFGEARVGMALLARHRVLRTLMTEASIWNLGNEVLILALTILVLQTYGFGPLVLGIILMCGGLGAFIGSTLSRRLTARFGYGRSLVAALLLGNTAPLIGVLAAATPTALSIGALAASFLVSGIGIGIANSQAVSLRQLAVAPELRARVNAGYRLVSWGALSVGAIAGGILVTALGPWSAAVLGGAVMAIASLPVALSPVRRIVSIDEVRPPGA